MTGLLRTQVLVITKAPVPGRSKTRLTPPCSPEQAAGIAAAAVADTLDAVRAAPVSRRVVALDGVRTALRSSDPVTRVYDSTWLKACALVLFGVGAGVAISMMPRVVPRRLGKHDYLPLSRGQPYH